MENNILKSILFAPKKYWTLSPERKKYICNSCGPKSKLNIIPNTIYLLNISPACDIHDYMYYVAGPYIEDKKEADRVFLNNMNRLIEYKTNKYIKIFKFNIINPLFILRKRRALKYYLVVKYFGGIFFWHNKN